MENSVSNAGLFLVNTLFNLYIFIWIIRIILVTVRADYFNPISQVIIKLTQPVVTPLRRILPTIAQIEFSSMAMILLLEMIKFFLIGLITIGMPNFIGLFILSIADILKTTINIFFYAILLQIILSWVQTSYSPFTYLLTQLTSPIIQPLRRLFPPIHGFDLTPIPALIGLQLLMILLVNPLLNSGLGIAFG